MPSPEETAFAIMRRPLANSLPLGGDDSLPEWRESGFLARWPPSAVAPWLGAVDRKGIVYKPCPSREKAPPEQLKGFLLSEPTFKRIEVFNGYYAGAVPPDRRSCIDLVPFVIGEKVEGSGFGKLADHPQIIKVVSTYVSPKHRLRLWSTTRA